MKKCRNKDLMELILYAVALGVLLIFAIGPVINKAVDERTVVVTVTDKGIKNEFKMRSRYLVYCKTAEEKTEVFEISDSILKFRFDSSDMYPNIEAGHTYKFTVCGKRMHLLSWYPNIYEYELIK